MSHFSISRMSSQALFKSRVKCPFVRSTRFESTKIAPTKEPSKSHIPPNPAHSHAGPRRSPNALDKRFLLWSGQYKTTNEIPDLVDNIALHKARHWGRVRISVGMLGVALGASIVAIYLGKQDAKNKLTLTDQNLEWHRKINEDNELKKKK